MRRETARSTAPQERRTRAAFGSGNARQPQGMRAVKVRRTGNRRPPQHAKREGAIGVPVAAIATRDRSTPTPRKRETPITESAGSSVSTAMPRHVLPPPVSRTGHPARTPGATVRLPAPRAAVRPSPIAAARRRPIGAIVTGPAVTPGRARPSVEGRIGHHVRTPGATARPPAPRAAVHPSPIAAARPRPIGAIVIGPAVTAGHARPSVEGRIGHHGRTRGATARPPAPRVAVHPSPIAAARPRPIGAIVTGPAVTAGHARPSVEGTIGHHGRTRGATARPPAPRVAVHPSPIAAARPRPIGAIVTGPAVTPGRAPPSVEGRIGHHGRTRGATARPPAPRVAVHPSPIAAARSRPIGAIVTGPAVTPGHARPSVEGRIGHHGRTRGATARPPAPRVAVHPSPIAAARPRPIGAIVTGPAVTPGHARPSVEGRIGHHGRTRGATARPPAPRAAVHLSPIAAARPRPTGAIVIGPPGTPRLAPPSVGNKAIVETRERAEPSDRSYEGGLGVIREPMNHLPRSGHEVPTANRTRERTRSRRRHRVRASRQSCLPAHQSEAGARGRTGGDRASRPVPSAPDAPQGGAGRTRRRLIRVSSRDSVDSSCSSGTTCHARPGVRDADALALSLCGTARVR